MNTENPNDSTDALNQQFEARLAENQRRLKTLIGELKMKRSYETHADHWMSIGQLATGIAHEINNPLGFVENNLFVMKMYTSKLTEMLDMYRSVCLDMTDPLFAPQKAKIEAAEERLKVDQSLLNMETLFTQTQEGMDRMMSITRSLKSFSKMNATGEAIYYNLNEGISNTLIICRNDYRYHSDIVTDYGDIPDIYCEGGKINQVLLNLIINASHAIRESMTDDEDQSQRGLIKIRTYDDEQTVYAEISDSGSGIRPDDLRKIFDPFFTTKDPDKGTGLGLSLSYDFLQKQGGDLRVKSEYGKGASFTISLPKKSVFPIDTAQ